MAGGAVIGELTLMAIGMTVAALGKAQPAVLTLYVAGSAGHVGMAATERKARAGVVHPRRLPTRGRVARGATAGKLAAVRVLMAGRAVGGQAQVRGTAMALVAPQAAMAALQSVPGGIVVKTVAVPTDQRKIDAPVVGMAVNAAPVRQASVVPGPCLEPGSQGLVALQALPFVQPLPKFVAFGALTQALQLRMGLGQVIGRQQLGRGCHWHHEGDKKPAGTPHHASPNLRSMATPNSLSRATGSDPPTQTNTCSLGTASVAVPVIRSTRSGWMWPT